MRSFWDMLNTAAGISREKSLSGFNGKVCMKVTKDEYSHAVSETLQSFPDVRLCDIPLRMTNG